MPDAVKQVMPFLFEGEALVRVLTKSDAPWFVAKDVCSVLGIVWKGSDSTGPLAEMDNDEKSTFTVETAGGNQEMVVLSESGLYSLIFRSRKPAAIRFRKWVTSEVIPAIRKTGSYALATETERQPEIAAPEHRPFPDWPLEEMRTKKGTADLYRMVYGPLSAQ